MSIPEDIAIPPPSLKQIIHKTTTVITQNGDEFLQKLKESNNASFQFINDGDMYFPYFQYCLGNPEVAVVDDKEKDKKSRKKEEEVQREELGEVEPLDFVSSGDTISIKDLELIKLTALYVSINGTDSISELKSKYDPLKLKFLDNDDQSTHRDAFLRYLNQYNLLRSLDLHYSLHKTHDQLLESSFQRATIQQYEKQQLRAQSHSEEQERLKYLKVDWMDFTVVQEIQFTELDEINDLPGPISLTELKYRTLEQKIRQTTAPAINGATAPASATTTQSEPTKTANGIKIKEFNARRSRALQSNKERQIECPITGRLIPESKFQSHIQILLRDPNYSQIKQNYEAKFKYDNLQGGVEQIVENLKGVIGKRRKA